MSWLFGSVNDTNDDDIDDIDDIDDDDIDNTRVISDFDATALVQGAKVTTDISRNFNYKKLILFYKNKIGIKRD